jgi:hypothetical protein
MIEHEQVHPVDEGWQLDIIADTEYRFRILFEREPNYLLGAFRNVIRIRLFANYEYVDGENMMLYSSNDGSESDEAYVHDINNLITMKKCS